MSAYIHQKSVAQKSEGTGASGTMFPSFRSPRETEPSEKSETQNIQNIQNIQNLESLQKTQNLADFEPSKKPQSESLSQVKSWSKLPSRYSSLIRYIQIFNF